MKPATWRKLALVSIAALAWPAAIHAQDYPPGDVRLVAAFPAGSGSDVVVRWFAERLRPLMSRTVIVENKPGAAGNIATEYVARAKPDGLTIYFHTGSSMSANASEPSRDSRFRNMQRSHSIERFCLLHFSAKYSLPHSEKVSAALRSFTS